MVNLQNRIFRFPLTPLTGVTIPGKHIFTHVPEAHLWSLLVLLPLDLGVAYLLKVELCYFNGCLADWQQFVHQLNGFQVRINPVLHGRGEPSLRSLPIEKTRLTIACLADSPRQAKLSARCH